jgi:hypothetical protein
MNIHLVPDKFAFAEGEALRPLRGTAEETLAAK